MFPTPNAKQIATLSVYMHHSLIILMVLWTPLTRLPEFAKAKEFHFMLTCAQEDLLCPSLRIKMEAHTLLFLKVSPPSVWIATSTDFLPKDHLCYYSRRKNTENNSCLSLQSGLEDYMERLELPAVEQDQQLLHLGFQ